MIEHTRSDERVGVLVIRVWTEPHGTPLLRARLTRSLDVSSPLHEVAASADADEIVAMVRSFLRDFAPDRRPGAEVRGRRRRRDGPVTRRR